MLFSRLRKLGVFPLQVYQTDRRGRGFIFATAAAVWATPVGRPRWANGRGLSKQSFGKVAGVVEPEAGFRTVARSGKSGSQLSAGMMRGSGGMVLLFGRDGPTKEAQRTVTLCLTTGTGGLYSAPPKR